MSQMTTCRACLGENLYLFLPLGDHPPANAFVSETRRSHADAAFSLDCHVCLDCGLIEVPDQLPPDFFQDYVYVPSASETMHAHFGAFARQIRERFAPSPAHLVVDIGCNDGLLLSACAGEGLATLGVEPAANIAAIARRKGLEVENVYFTAQSAERIRDAHGPAAVVTTTNTFNHIDDLHGFMRGVEVLLAPDGVFIVEVPQALELVEQNEFDTVYHEHLSTFSVTSLAALFRFFSLRIVDIQVLPIHGGSMRVVAQRRGTHTGELPAVQAWLDRERERGLFERSTYDALATRVHRIREDLVTMLRDFRADGRTLAAYGAPAKGNTLLNYYGIGPDLLDFLADRNPLKQGKYSPGMRIPVVSPDRILETQPDYLLILAWNFGDEIMRQQDEYRRRGGRFILPIPEPRVVA
jgi:SAM-dependent methyltransferase